MTITADELVRLRVPLSALPGLDPVGLRVHLRGYDGLCLAADTKFNDALVAFSFNDPETVQFALCEVDLADASTADRVARWLAGRVGLTVGSTAPGWVNHHGYRWMLWGDGDAPYVFGDPNDTGAVICRHVDGIPFGGGDRRLPDGSRYVDRLALALVCQHVGSKP